MYRRHFHAVVARGIVAPKRPDLPLLVVGNHVSWWDFVVWELQKWLRPGGSLHTVMLEEELRKVWVFRRLGCEGIVPGQAASFKRALDRLRAERALRGGHFCGFYFPQGSIWPSTKRPLGFQRGVEIFARALAPCEIVPVGLHIESMHRQKPTLFLQLAPSRLVESKESPISASELEASVESALDLIQADLHREGEKTVERWLDDPTTKRIEKETPPRW